MSPKRKPMYAGDVPMDLNDHEEKPGRQVPSPFILVLLGFYMLVAYCVDLTENKMPPVVTKQDIGRMDTSDESVFSEESAKEYLLEILGDGPRVAGTTYHLTKARDLYNRLGVIANKSSIPIRIDWQYASGDYWLDFSVPHVNCYRNLSNIIALLEGESGVHPNGTVGSSLLINCHYDSVPYAIGASDNGVFCAAMVEILSRFSNRSRKFRHNIIFLFNGAEETSLQGSHGFLKHPWARGVVGVINLDAAGMNGFPNLFQVIDQRFLNAYQKTNPRPSAQSVGEALFRSGLVPSDTDFRIFRDFGEITGVDIAFVKWGTVYHTRNDEPSLLKNGVIQAAGNMLMGLARELADEDILVNREPSSAMVYYDYLTVFMVSYSSVAALLVDSLVAVLAVASAVYYIWTMGFRQRALRELAWAVAGRAGSAAAGLAAVAGLTALVVLTTTQMRYLGEPWMVVPMYWLPYLIASVAFSHIFDSWRSTKCGLSRVCRASQAKCSARLLQTAVLVAAIPLPGLTTARYIVTVLLALSSAASLISITVLRWLRPAVWQQLVLEAVLALPAVLFVFMLSLRFSALVLPLGGRSGSSCPDCTVAVLSAGLALLTASIPSGNELLFSRKRLWMVLGALASVCVIIMFIPFSPYRGTATQRHYWFHTEVSTYAANMSRSNSWSGVVVTRADEAGPRAAAAAIAGLGGSPPQLSWLEDRDCQDKLFCDLPQYRPRFDTFLTGSLLVSTGPPKPFPHELRLASRTCSGTTCRLAFLINGPANNLITLYPRPNVTLSSWSFSSPVKATDQLKARPLYVILHLTGTYAEVFQPLEFNVTLDVPQPLQSGIMLDVVHNANKVYHPEDYTQEYRQLVDSMPEYFNIATFLSFRSNYVF